MEETVVYLNELKTQPEQTPVESTNYLRIAGFTAIVSVLAFVIARSVWLRVIGSRRRRFHNTRMPAPPMSAKPMTATDLPSPSTLAATPPMTAAAAPATSGAP